MFVSPSPPLLPPGAKVPQVTNISCQLGSCFTHLLPSSAHVWGTHFGVLLTVRTTESNLLSVGMMLSFSLEKLFILSECAAAGPKPFLRET